MEKLTHFPLHAQEDAIKRALILGGFTLIDDGCAEEVETPDWAIQLFDRPEGKAVQPIYLEDGKYTLRSELLAAQLSSIGSNLPIKAFSAGKTYDANDPAHPCYTHVQGIWAEKDIPLNEYLRFGTLLAENVFGIGTTTELKTAENGSVDVVVTVGKKSFTFATTGRASALARALLGIQDDGVSVWVFDINVDNVTMAVNDIKTRDDLFSPLMSKLSKYRDNDSTFGRLYYSRAANTLRSMGFCEFSGLKVYEEDCYKKMNMIQESWDRNNAGMQLVEPLGKFTGIPTVLVPALQEALAANWKAGEKECRIFEIGHIFLPGIAGAAPIEKTALVMGAYGPDMDANSWKGIIDQFLNEFGIERHYFIPLPPGQAPAYNPMAGWVIMDENMKYLESNFGAISPVALKNHGIDTDAFMVQFEFEPIEAKAMEEFDFTPPDYL